MKTSNLVIFLIGFLVGDVGLWATGGMANLSGNLDKGSFLKYELEFIFHKIDYFCEQKTFYRDLLSIKNGQVFVRDGIVLTSQIIESHCFQMGAITIEKICGKRDRIQEWYMVLMQYRNTLDSSDAKVQELKKIDRYLKRAQELQDKTVFILNLVQQCQLLDYGESRSKGVSPAESVAYSSSGVSLDQDLGCRGGSPMQ